MFAFVFGVATSFIIFILILYYLHQFSTDSEYRALLDQRNAFHLKQQSENGNLDIFKSKISLKDETVKWLNTLFSQIFTHFRGDSQSSDIELLNGAISSKLPPGFSFKLDTIGKDIIFDKPKLFRIQESKSDIISNSFEEKEILKIDIPIIYNGLSFTILCQIDGKDKENKIVQIPIFEFDFKRIEAVVSASLSFENQNKEDNKSNNDFILNLSLELEKDENILDFESSIILNSRKITITNCPVFGNFIKKLFQFFIVRRKLNFLIPSSKINFDKFRGIIEKQNIIQVELNII